MSFFETASLVLISDFAAASASMVSGSGTNTGKAYSIKPTDGSGDFTFERGSDITATRVNKDGSIEKGRGNFLLQSNQFDTTWVNELGGSPILTSGQAGYDGTNDAWLVGKGAEQFKRITQSISASGVWTFSVYAKANTQDTINLRDQTNGIRCEFDLTNGVVVYNQNGIYADIIDIGNGWYRCFVAHNQSTSLVSIYIGWSDYDAGSVYLQDAQLEVGLVATDYIETGASTAQAGILEDMPRLDYSGGATCGSLLLEPQRTNIVTQSEALSLISATNSTITQNENVSPEGNQNGSLWTADVVTNGTVECEEQYSTSSGTVYTESWFVKYSGQQFVQLVTTSATFGAKYGNFDLINGIKGNGNFTDFRIEQYTNDWYRISATETATSTGTGRLAGLRFISSLTAPRGGTVTTDGSQSIEIYGHQVEAGSYATSYIPTYGASVTRGADSCTNADVSSLLGSGVGTAFIDMVVNGQDTQGNIPLTIGTGTSNLIYLWIQTSQTIRYEAYTGGTLEGAVNTASGFYTYGDRIKVALVWADNDFAMYINGTQIGTDTSGTAPTPTKLWLGEYTSGNYKGGSINQAILFPTRLSNDELATLTTL